LSDSNSLCFLFRLRYNRIYRVQVSYFIILLGDLVPRLYIKKGKPIFRIQNPVYKYTMSKSEFVYPRIYLNNTSTPFSKDKTTTSLRFHFCHFGLFSWNHKWVVLGLHLQFYQLNSSVFCHEQQIRNQFPQNIHNYKYKQSKIRSIIC
jgi:hypothetical protein